MVVDEAGNPPLRPSGVPNGYVSSAVAIPTGIREKVELLLPRDPDSGEPLKSSSVRTTDVMLATFFERFFSMNVSCGLVSVDSADRSNVDLLQEAVDYANANRLAQHSKVLRPMSVAYWLLAPRATVLSWAAVSLQQGKHLRHFDVVFDEANLPSKQRRPFIEGIKSAFDDQGVVVGTVRWASEQDEPLLHVPDYIAGVTLRTSTKNDCPAAWEQLKTAQARGQISTQDPVTIYTLPPRR
jgi:hypothetical protein